MNDYLKYLIETYYLKEKLNHDKLNGRGTKSYIDDIDLLFENIGYNNLITEEYHISDMFDIVIDKIEELYFGNVNNKEYKMLDTGYALKYINSKPNVIKVNDNADDKLYKIYIKIIFEENSNVYSAVEDKNSIICILLNSARIKNSKELLRASCKHEFLHVREMYSNEFFNVLQNKKNKIPISIDNVFKWDKRYENFAADFCYMFQPSELRARLNAYKEFISLNKFDNFELSLKNTNEVTLLNDMHLKVQQLDIFLNDTKNYSAIEIYIYYCLKYNISHTKYKDFSFDIRKRFYEYTQDQINIMEAFIFELKKLVVLFNNDLNKQYFKTL